MSAKLLVAASVAIALMIATMLIASMSDLTETHTTIILTGFVGALSGIVGFIAGNNGDSK